jgi:hypothetical protein
MMMQIASNWRVMKFLMCILCDGELDLVNPFDFGHNKKVKCRRCGFISPDKRNHDVKKNKGPEVVIIKKK